MIKNYILSGMIALAFVGCNPKDRVTDSSNGDFSLSKYIPLKEGNSWTYSSFTVHTAGFTDTSASYPLILSVFQTNVLIGGQPNAFIVHTDNEHGGASYLAFAIDGNTLLNYLGSGGSFNVQDTIIVWIPGGVSGAVVGLNQTQQYRVIDPKGASESFSLFEAPDPSIALVTMTSQADVRIKGLAVGQTTFTLKKINGTAADTMTVLLGVANNLPSIVSSPLPPWIPLWQLTHSSSGETIFSLDTISSFRCISDSSLCRDELQYLVTNRYVASEVVPALNSTLRCDRFEMKITVTERVTSTDKIQTRVLFSGLSTEFTIDTWLAEGIGFVRGIVNGNTLSFVAAMGGIQDSGGILKGFYISPRVAYASIPSSDNSYTQIFQVNDAPLSVSPDNNEFLLQEKNF